MDIENPIIKEREKADEQFVIAFCVNCDTKIYSGNRHLSLDETELLCDENCLMEYLAIKIEDDF